MCLIHTDVRSLDHADIVPSVPDTADSLLSVVTDKTGDIGFLRWRASASYDGRELRRDLDELVAEHVETELTSRVSY